MPAISLPSLAHPVASNLLLVAACLILLFSIAKLLRVRDSLSSILRRMCVADIAWIFLGFASGGADGGAGALLTFAYVGAARLLAWLCLARLTAFAGTDGRAGLRGAGRARPVTATLFAFAMFAALGISPFQTPEARPLVLHAALAGGLFVVPALMVLCNALMAVRTVQAVHALWLARGEFAEEKEPLGAPAQYPLFALAALVALLGIFGHEFMRLAAALAGEGAGALPPLGVEWHPAAMLPFCGAFVVWIVGRVSRSSANIVALCLMGLALIFALGDPVADPLGRLFTILITGMGLLVTLYSCSYIHKPADGPAHAQNSYFFFLLLLFGSLAGVSTSTSLGSLFVFWELMTLSSYVLVAYENTREAHHAAIRYFIMCTVASAFL
ncbi:oxidoreductase, partial [Desulfovibrio sp. OttesenSCG-928-A18]|nr:oxidoreductase [Desulfovibrio sp. OttesenSCG-928-A18]